MVAVLKMAVMVTVMEVTDDATLFVSDFVSLWCT